MCKMGEGLSPRQESAQTLAALRAAPRMARSAGGPMTLPHASAGKRRNGNHTAPGTSRPHREHNCVPFYPGRMRSGLGVKNTRQDNKKRSNAFPKNGKVPLRFWTIAFSLGPAFLAFRPRTAFPLVPKALRRKLNPNLFSSRPPPWKAGRRFPNETIVL